MAVGDVTWALSVGAPRRVISQQPARSITTAATSQHGRLREPPREAEAEAPTLAMIVAWQSWRVEGNETFDGLLPRLQHQSWWRRPGCRRS
jgi:hypothetical protein